MKYLFCHKNNFFNIKIKILKKSFKIFWPFAQNPEKNDLEKNKFLEEIFHGGDLAETGDAGLASVAEPHGRDLDETGDG